MNNRQDSIHIGTLSLFILKINSYVSTYKPHYVVLNWNKTMVIVSGC